MNIFTTAAPTGVAVRDITVIVGAVITVLGVLGLLDEEQRKTLTEQAPELMTAVGTLITIGTSIYRVVTKSHSDKAAEVAKEIDAKIPEAEPVVIKTPSHQPDIVVQPKG